MTALKTVAMRLRGTDTKTMEEEDLETDGAITSKSKLRGKVKRLSGVDILTDSGAYKSTYQILSEIADVWENINDVDQAALLELLAGKRAGSVMSAILQNPETLKNAFESANNAAGSALAENEKYLDSIQGKIDLLTNSIQTMWNNALSSEAIKNLVSIATELIKIVDNVGLLKSLLIGIGTYTIAKHFNGSLFGEIQSSQNINYINDKLESLRTESEEANATAKSNPSTRNKNKAKRAEQRYNRYDKNTKAYRDEYAAQQKQLDSLKAQREQYQKELSKAEADVKDIWSQGEYGGLEEDFDNANKKVDELKGKIAETDNNIQKAEQSLKSFTKNTGSFGSVAKKSWKTFTDGAKKAGKEILKIGTAMLEAYVMIEAMDLIFKGLEKISSSMDNLYQSAEEAQEEFKNLNSELSSAESEIKDLESELDTTQKRIDELLAQEKLSFTDQEELDKLRSQSEELKNQIALAKTLRDNLQASVNEAAINATGRYLEETSFASETTKSERVESAGSTGKSIGTVAGYAIGSTILAAGISKAVGAGAAAIGGKIGAALGSVAPGIGNIIGLAVGTVAGGLIGKVIGKKVAGADYEKEQTVQEAINSMGATREKLIKAKEDAYKAYADNPTDEKLEEEFNKASSALSDYDQNMAKHMTTLQEAYSAIDVSKLDLTKDADKATLKNKQMIGDMLDKYNIIMGGDSAKSGAINRIFNSEEASKELKDLDKQIKETLESGGDFDFYEVFNNDNLKETKQRLDELGISITDLKYYYLDWKKSEEETESSTYDTVKTVANLTNSISALKDAFGEFNENGLVTANTLVELYDIFGSLGDAWDNYVDVMATGTSSTEQAKKATEELLEALMNQRLEQGPIKDMKEYLTLIGQLQSLGVTNAKDYVDALQRASAITGVGKSVVNQQKDLAKLEEQYKNGDITGEEYNEKEKNLRKTTDDFIRQYEEDYDITFSEEERLAIEKAITAEKAEQNKIDAQTQANEYEEAVRKKEEADKELEEAKNEKRKVSEVGTKYQRSGQVWWEYNGEYYIDGNAMVADQAAIDAAQAKVNAIVIPTEVDVDAAEQNAENAADELQKVFDDMGLTVQIELVESDQLVDDIQSVYDTLKKAQKEYTEGGYLSVDTMQELLGLEPKYLNLLYDENGQLNLNEQALLKVAEARIIDMGITQQKAILEESMKLATEGSRESLLEYITTIEDATDANGDFVKSQLAAIKAQLKARTIDKKEQKTRTRRGRNGEEITETVTVITAADLSEAEADQIYKGIENSVNAVQKTVDLAVKGLPKGGLSSGSGGGSEESALEKIQKKYERQISNLDNQKTYLQNEVDRLEAENKGISKSYYTEQIKLEEKKAKLLQQERKELTNLLNSTAKGSDDWWDVANALWEVDHAIQDSTLAIIEARKEIAALYKTAFDKLETAYENKDDIYDQRIEYIDKFAELYEIQDEEAPMSVYLAKIAETQNKQNNLLLEIADLEKAREAALADAEAGIEGGDETYDELTKTLNEKYIEYQENVNSIAEYTKNIKELQVKAFDIIRKAYDNRNDFYDDQQSYMEGYIDYLEASGVDATPEMYEKLIEIEKEKRANNVENLINARAGVEKLKAAGYTMADDELVDAEKQVRELEKAVQDNDIAIKQWEKDIQELEFEKFDKFAERVNNFNKELENVRKLIDDEDVAFEDGTWTKEGITNLSMLYHQIENNTNMIAKYNDEMAKLEAQYKAGEISESDYIERAQELKDQQWELVLSNEELKDSIIDINEARIDLVEEGINKEVDAYRELIELKRDELSAERELYEFRQDVEDQTRDIAELERKIASLSGADDAASVAERRRLEAELRDKNRDLESTYYGHAKDSQSTALDDEMEAYEKAGEDYIESLRDKLENVNLMIEQTLQEVLFNADVTFNELSTLATENNITLSQNLMTPWQKMSELATMTKDQIGVELLNLNEDSVAPFSDYAGTLLTAPFETGGIACIGFKTLASTQIAELQAQVYNASSDLLRDLSYPWTGAEAPINTFSQTTDAALQGAIVEAQAAAVKMTTSNEQPWKAGIGAAQLWSSEVEKAYDNAIKKSQEYAAQVAKEQAVSTPSYTTTKPHSSSGGGGGGGGGTSAQKKEVTRKMGDYGPINKQINIGSTAYLNQNTKHVAGSYYYYDKNSNTYYELNDVKQKKDHGTTMHYIPVGTHRYKYHAKGTLGTKKDQWAITDEPQFGDELVLVPTSQGNLSYMRKGTSVVPADITKNLVEWGQLDPNMITSSGVGANINIINSAVNKPEIKLDIENFLRCDNVSQDALPELEKFVNEKMNNLVKQLNYGLKKFK